METDRNCADHPTHALIIISIMLISFWHGIAAKARMHLRTLKSTEFHLGKLLSGAVKNTAGKKLSFYLIFINLTEHSCT